MGFRYGFGGYVLGHAFSRWVFRGANRHENGRSSDELISQYSHSYILFLPYRIKNLQVFLVTYSELWRYKIVHRARLRIRGRVQGVFYRKSAEEAANKLGLAGWVRNMPDGSVEAYACGDRETIESFANWCHAGPPGARVESVDLVWREHAEEDDEKHVEPGCGFSVTWLS